MFKKYEPPIVGYPYPTATSGHYRCFDGEKWHDCGKLGKVKKYGVDD